MGTDCLDGEGEGNRPKGTAAHASSSIRSPGHVTIETVSSPKTVLLIDRLVWKAKVDFKTEGV